MGNGSRASVHGVGMVNLKLTSEKTVQLKNMQHIPSINKNLISGSLLCRDGFKLVFESTKVVISNLYNLVERVMSAEVCSAYLYQTHVLKLLIMFAMIMSPMFGIHDSIILTLVA